MELTWTKLEVNAAPEGSAYAEFWLNARGTAEPQRVLAGVVRHIRPVLEDWLHARLDDDGKPTSGDPRSAAP